MEKSDSILKSLVESVIDTNESVRATNKSVIETNRITKWILSLTFFLTLVGVNILVWQVGLHKTSIRKTEITDSLLHQIRQRDLIIQRQQIQLEFHKMQKKH